MEKKNKPIARINPKLAMRPILNDQPSDLIHTRRNLLIINSIFLFSVISDVALYPKFFNENFIQGKLTEADVGLAILLVTLYLLISFLWKFTDYYRSQIILTTQDIELYSVRHFGDVIEEKSFREPGQYSLSAWWARTSENMQVLYNRIEIAVENLSLDENIRKQIDNIRDDTRTIASMYKAASNDDVGKALENFDKSVFHFIYSQKLRVNVVDLAFPVLISVTTITILLYRLVFEKLLNNFFTLFC